MPTPAERRALLFLGGLIIMGGGVRAARAVGAAAPGPDSASLAALDRQLGAVDSARAAKGLGGRRTGSRRTRSSRSRSGGPARADTGEGKPRGARKRGRQAAAPPAGGVPAGSGVSSGAAPRPEVYYLAPPRTRAGGTGRSTAARASRGTRLAPGQRIDLDRATAAELERLPRVGPVLARRIVADRDSLGPFGSLETFRRVRGVGPAMLRILAPYVTFSTPPRQSGVVNGGGNRPRSRRRTGRAQPP